MSESREFYTGPVAMHLTRCLSLILASELSLNTTVFGYLPVLRGSIAARGKERPEAFITIDLGRPGSVTGLSRAEGGQR